MSGILSKAEYFLKSGAYVLWFGMHLFTALMIRYYQDWSIACYYLVTFPGLGSFMVWFFGHRVFPKYLSNEGKLNQELIVLVALYGVMLVFGSSAHWLASEALETYTYPLVAPLGVRITTWLLIVLLGCFLMASVQLMSAYHVRTLRKIGQKADRAEAELQLLKAQISPHFLFNTLNNIYGLAYMQDGRAADMISRLSKIMRYLLDDCERPTVRLAKEKELIEHYLHLQLLKHEGAKNVDFYNAGVLQHHSIVPMLLINFVENCFKHSDLESNPKAWIKISLEVENDELVFQTENTVKTNVEKRPEGQRGIGLANSLKLLEANYPDSHQVSIRTENQVYHLNLKLTL